MARLVWPGRAQHSRTTSLQHWRTKPMALTLGLVCPAPRPPVKKGPNTETRPIATAASIKARAPIWRNIVGYSDTCNLSAVFVLPDSASVPPYFPVDAVQRSGHLEGGLGTSPQIGAWARSCPSFGVAAPRRPESRPCSSPPPQARSHPPLASTLRRRQSTYVRGCSPFDKYKAYASDDPRLGKRLQAYAMNGLLGRPRPGNEGDVARMPGDSRGMPRLTTILATARAPSWMWGLTWPSHNGRNRTGENADCSATEEAGAPDITAISQSVVALLASHTSAQTCMSRADKRQGCSGYTGACRRGAAVIDAAPKGKPDHSKALPGRTRAPHFEAACPSVQKEIRGASNRLGGARQGRDG